MIFLLLSYVISLPYIYMFVQKLHFIFLSILKGIIILLPWIVHLQRISLLVGTLSSLLITVNQV